MSPLWVVGPPGTTDPQTCIGAVVLRSVAAVVAECGGSHTNLKRRPGVQRL